MSEAVMDMYNALEEVGFSQNQIDEMDIVYHLKRLARRKETTENPKPNENDQMYIDQILG
ncbi:hypothetical protein ACT3UT_14190 [Bacillus spizizenii ATCC 6633 = JCM 2499]|uniref:Uncharacterized protein n=1 Tax=Bacillus spizizenii (strain ATCC 23059 / NRRL B-14472 / W23) TaxID=655816 RepID=E0TX51_BACSH|nr:MULTISPECIES: hypothetical protein [Bacillus subtilis group]ADM37957.1 hypothetical protein BSUW23_09555 [Bacillus spizizenii str. W23]AJW87290.1 hypothetical protein BIS30_20145 [Bacillus spizizenii]MBE0174221.1 hypothetical protein [Bacillus spizizenii]MBT3130095.1 hypothetical protein [Bacillus spizizenii]MCM3414603.1 hypothetical protein [Bacillus spizizenii]